MKHKNDAEEADKISNPLIDELSVIQERTTAYSLMCGLDDNEYYTFSCPQIDDNSVILNNPFQKGVITEIIIDQQVEEFYVLSLDKPLINFDMSQGVLIKKHSCDQLNWLGKTVLDAQNVIKDKIILKYQQIVPSMLNSIKTLQNQSKQTQQTGKRRNYVDDELIDL